MIKQLIISRFISVQPLFLNQYAHHRCAIMTKSHHFGADLFDNWIGEA